MVQMSIRTSQLSQQPKVAIVLKNTSPTIEQRQEFTEKAHKNSRLFRQ